MISNVGGIDKKQGKCEHFFVEKCIKELWLYQERLFIMDVSASCTDMKKGIYNCIDKLIITKKFDLNPFIRNWKSTYVLKYD